MPISDTERDHDRERIAAANQRLAEVADALRDRDALVRELHAKGWTQVELAEEVGITQQRISRIIKKEQS